MQDPPVKVLLAAAAPVAAATGLVASVEIAAAAGIASLGLAAVAGFGNSDGVPLPVTELDETEASSYHDTNDSTLSRGILYASHPKQDHTLIPTTLFQAIVLKEQQADIIDYIRSVVPARSITIRMKVGDGTSQVGSLFTSAFVTKRAREWETLTELLYDRQEIIPATRRLAWLDRFPSLLAGLRGTTSGSARFIERMQQNASLNAQMASRAGFNSDASSRYDIEIVVKW